MENNGLSEAVASAGGPGEVAKGLTALLKYTITPQVIGNWIARGRVPAERCPDLEKLYGIRCERIRPDVNWGYLRSTECNCEKVA